MISFLFIQFVPLFAACSVLPWRYAQLPAHVFPEKRQIVESRFAGSLLYALSFKGCASPRFHTAYAPQVQLRKNETRTSRIQVENNLTTVCDMLAQVMGHAG